jgi:MFS superfamily sulfate permease-like transporter
MIPHLSGRRSVKKDVASGSTLAVGEATARDALLLLTLMTGAFTVLFGLLRLGSILRFVPDSVGSALTHAVGLSIILGQTRR